jgi:hypothetical protein
MTTFAIHAGHLGNEQFEDVESNVRLISTGVRFANQTSFVLRVIWKAGLLFHVFSRAVKKQQELIDEINGPATQTFTSENLLDLAGHIEHLVALDDELLEVAAPRTRTFEPWMDKLAEIRVQRDTLESISESLRSAADPECQELLVATLEKMFAN